MTVDVDEVRARLALVVTAMKQEGAWDVARPPDAAFTDMGAFGMRTMAFVQWLRHVFVPSIEARIAAGGPWPSSSSVAVQATREGDTDEHIAALVQMLQRFDDLFRDDNDKRAEAARAYQASRDTFARGDHEAALIEVRRALELDPACDNAENFVGWILLKKPGRTQDELEQAIAHFRRAPAGVASANLADALVAAGRLDEAVAATQLLSNCAEALNWMGWHYLEHEHDPTRAVAALREAVQARRWGVAWQNLGKALDALGDAREACAAYGEAVACGDAYDDALARDRRVQLEMLLRTRGESPPVPPALARADSAAAQLVLATAAHPPLAVGQRFFLRPTTRVPDGAIAYAGVATVVSERVMYHALIRDDGGTQAAFVQTREDPVALRWTNAADATLAASWLAEWIAADGANVYALTPLDTAVFLFDLLGREAARRWRLVVVACRPAALAIEDVDVDLGVVVKAGVGGSVEVDLGDGERIQATSPAQLVPHAPAIVASVRRALASAQPRSTHARGDRIAVSGRVFADALAAALEGTVRAVAVERDHTPASAVFVGDRPLALVLDSGMLHVWVPPQSFHVGIGDDATARLSEVIATARERAAAVGARPSVLEIALRTCERLEAALAERWTVAVPSTSEIWLRGAHPEADSVGVFDGKVRVADEHVVHVARLGEIDEHVDDLVAWIRGGRERFARLAELAERMRGIADRLCNELGARLGVHLQLGRRPSPPRPVATIVEASHSNKIAVELSVEGDAIQAHAGAPGTEGWNGQVDELSDVAVDYIAEAIRRRRALLTRADLVERARYRVREDLDDLRRGTVVRFEGFDDIDNHYGRLMFVDEATGREHPVVGDFSEPDRGPLADAYRYLEPL